MDKVIEIYDPRKGEIVYYDKKYLKEISNKLTDMVLNGADEAKTEKAVKESMGVIDSMK